jgi:hypothetical protein
MNEPTEAPDASDAQAGEPTIDVELRNMPAIALDVGGATSTEGLVGVIRGWIADQRQTNEDVRAAFLNERLAEVSALVAVGVPVPRISGNPAEIEDLGRRLWAKAEENQLQLRPPGALAGVRPAVILNDANPGSAMLVYKQGRPSVAAEIDAKVAAGDALVCAEMTRLLADAAERAARLRAQYPDGLLYGALLDQKTAPDWLNELLARVAAKNLTMVEVEDLPSGWVDPGLAYRVHLALVWPEVEAGWRQAQENQRKAQTELLRLHRESATAFAKEQTHGLGLTGAELESLAGLLAERDLHALGTNPELASLETMRAAAASNPLVRNAIGAYEKWTANKCKPSGDQNALTWRMGFAWHWPEVLRGWLTTNAERLAARAALLSAANQEKNPDALAAEAVAEGRLEQAVRELMPSAIKAVRVPPREGLEALGGKSMFALDAALADFIAGLTLNGAREAANDWREKWRADWSQARTPGEPACWERWADPLRIPRVLARVLWTLDVRPKLERELGRKDAAGVIAPVLTSLVSASRRGVQVELFEDKARILDKRGQVVGEVRVGPTIDGQVIRLNALGTLAAQRLLRFAIWEGYEKRYIREEPNFAELWVDGGWQALAKKFGQTAGKATKEIREAAYALDAISIDTPRGIGRIFAVHEHKPGPGRPARVEMHLLGPLRPGYVTDELALHRLAEDKRIVPVPMPNKLPPMVGRENEWASQAQMQLLALRELRTHAEELATNGAVEISEKRWRELAEEASLPLRLVAEVLGAFVGGNADAPAFLTRPKGWTFNLADAYGAERKAILSAGTVATRGRTAGRKGAARKAAGRFGNKGGRRG